MSESSKYNNQFNFNKGVGIVNTGDVEIHGDQIGVQLNKVSEKTLAEYEKEIQDLLNQFSQTYTKEELVVRFDEEISKNSRIKQMLLAGGIELVKIICPPSGIPIEMAKRWLETAKRNH
jgi:hypothetical protein